MGEADCQGGILDSKTKIIKSAMKVFLLKGYDATSINDVVTESQLSKGGIYHHFTNKKDLFLQTIDFMFDEFEKWDIEMYSLSMDLKVILQTYFGSLSIIHEFVRNLVDSDEVNVDSFYKLMMEAFIKFPEIKAKHNETHEQNRSQLVILLKEAQKQDVIKSNLDCETIAFMINAMAEGTILYHILNEKIDLKEMGNKIFSTLWDGISTEKK